MKSTWSKKFHFPGCQNGKDEIKFVPMPPAAVDIKNIIAKKIGDHISTYKPDAIQMIPVDKAVFGDEWLDRDLVTRAQEIFGDSPEKFEDRFAWLSAMMQLEALVVKKHSHGGQTIFVVMPLALK